MFKRVRDAVRRGKLAARREAGRSDAGYSTGRCSDSLSGLAGTMALRTREISGQNSMITASVVMLPTSQFDHMIVILPCDISIAWRNAFSALLPSTRASTIGASG